MGDRKVEEGDDSRTTATEVVTFPVRKPQVEPLKLESELSQHDSNSLIWKVIAVGGLVGILVHLGWTKWQERKANAKKGDSTDDQKGELTEEKSVADDEK